MDAYSKKYKPLIVVVLLMSASSMGFAQKFYPKLGTTLSKTSPKITTAVSPITPALQRAVFASQQKSTTVHVPPGQLPIPLVRFSAWASHLQNQSSTMRSTAQALQITRNFIDNYASLSASEQSALLHLINQLELYRDKQGHNGTSHFYKLVYQGTLQENTLPQVSQFHLLTESTGFNKNHPLIEKVSSLEGQRVYLSQPFHNKICAINLTQGIVTAQARQELETVIDTLTPPGYHVRLGVHELGLSNDRKSFRQGKLHIHFDKEDATEGSFPTDKSIEFFLNLTPLAGLMDTKTRRITYPFSDKMIAKNYLNLLHKYLIYTDENGTPHYTEGGRALCRIIFNGKF